MSDPYLSISSSNGTIALNGIASAGTGAEAQPGATGLGLPPIEAVFSNGAGDGSFYVGRRVLSRTPEFEVGILGTSRADLKDKMRTLSRIVTAEDVVLHWIEPGVSEHTIKAHLIGGGDYTYGVETTGGVSARTTFKFQSEDPYWQDVDDVVTTATGIVAPSGIVAVNNPGTVQAAPVIRVTGPTSSFKVSLGSQSYRYLGAVLTGETIEIDHRDGTVRRASDGSNVYQNLDALPRFFDLPSGSSNLIVEVAPITMSETRTNYITNPVPKTRAGWTHPTDATADSVNGGITVPALSAKNISATQARTRMTISGLTPGTRLGASVRVTASEGTHRLYVRSSSEAVLGVASSGGWASNKYLEVSGFTVPADGIVIYSLETILASGGGNLNRAQVKWNQMFMGDQGDFFYGGTPDTASTNYSWTGTVDGSTSTAVTSGTTLANVTVEVSFNPLEWLVI